LEINFRSPFFLPNKFGTPDIKKTNPYDTIRSLFVADPNFEKHFSVKSLATLIVENLFGEVRSNNSMPLMAQFCHMFEATVRERLKRQSGCSFSYYTGGYNYYPQISKMKIACALPKMAKPDKISILPQERIQLLQFRVEYGQSVPQKTVRNMTVKDNPGTLPVILYQVECPESIVDLHTTMNTEKEVVENTKSRPCLY
jgi:hypothetical protein